MKQITCKNWLLKKHIKGITLYPYVFYQGEPSEALKYHESIHLEQIKKEGFLKFYTKYVYYDLKYGYEKNPYEIEAHKKTYEKFGTFL